MATVDVTPDPPARLRVRFPYARSRVHAIRAVPGRRWHPDHAAWSVPDGPDALDVLRRAFPDDVVRYRGPESHPGGRTRDDADLASSSASTGRPPASDTRSPAPPDWRATLLDRTRRNLLLRGYSPRTRRAYLVHVRGYLRTLDAPPGDDAIETMQAFLLHRI
ncbi:MAG: hypothetical protein P8174_00675, partial [Gemmatimonadota bacterium]